MLSSTKRAAFVAAALAVSAVRSHAAMAAAAAFQCRGSLPTLAVAPQRTSLGFRFGGAGFAGGRADFYGGSNTGGDGSLAAASLVGGSSLGFTELDDAVPYRNNDNVGGAAEEEDDLLSYLRSADDLPPETRGLLRRVTSLYVNNKQQRRTVALGEIIRVIDEEHIFEPVPFSVGEATRDGGGADAAAEVESEAMSKILSFAALHRVPKEITLALLEADGSEDSVALRAQFEIGGWGSVSFPEGLAVRLKRQHAPSRGERYYPLPRRLIRSRAACEAERAVREACAARPPTRKLRLEDLFAMMENAKGLSARSFLSAAPERFQDLNFFPIPSNDFFSRISRATDRQTAKLKAIGRGGLISYAFLNAAWYTIAIVVQWRRLTSSEALLASSVAIVPHGGLAAAVGASFRKFGRALLSARVGSRATGLPRLYAAAALAPLGNSALRLAERRLRLGEATAFWTVAGLLASSCLGCWATLVVGGAIFGRGPVPYALTCLEIN